MKKWLMLSFLPLLLLAQQEAGATLLPLETLVSIAPPSTLSADDGYNATISYFDTKTIPDGISNAVIITVVFGTAIDMSVASKAIQNPLIQNQQPPVPDSDVQLNTLMAFAIWPVSLVPPPPPSSNIQPILTLLELTTTDPSNIVYDLGSDVTFIPSLFCPNCGINGYTMTASYAPGDANLLPKEGEFTCMGTGHDNEDAIYSTTRCAQILSAPVPVPNSLMLLGIGLLALTIPQRRGKLS